jgi:hypothetical protein
VIAVHRRSWHVPSGGRYTEHLGELAFGERIAGFHTEPVRGHRCVIAGSGFEPSVTMSHPGRGGRLPGMLTVWPQPPTFTSADATASAASSTSTGTLLNLHG